MADQAVDCGVIEEEIIFLVILSGLVVNRYATIQGVTSSDAAGDLATFERGLVNIGLDNWKDGLVACGTDGASVMTRVRNGVAAKLREDGHVFTRRFVSLNIP